MTPVRTKHRKGDLTSGWEVQTWQAGLLREEEDREAVQLSPWWRHRNGLD